MSQPSPLPFPPPESADAGGLLCVGGELSAAQVWLAHQSGVFPWFGDNSPILWWSPDPRAVIPCQALHCSRSLRKRLRRRDYEIRYDSAFTQVIAACATLHGETWITADIRRVYHELHQQGRAHSCELWINDRLCGGLYGVCLHRVFCGESMFSSVPSASKIVLAELCAQLHRLGIELLDTQFMTPHLHSMGAVEIRRADYLSRLGGNPDRLRGNWDGLFPSPA